MADDPIIDDPDGPFQGRLPRFQFRLVDALLIVLWVCVILGALRYLATQPDSALAVVVALAALFIAPFMMLGTILGQTRNFALGSLVFVGVLAAVLMLVVGLAAIAGL